MAGATCLLIGAWTRTYDQSRARSHACAGSPGVDARHVAEPMRGRGRPSLAGIRRLLRRLGAAGTARDINNLLLASVLNWLLGNSDAHGKNFGLVHGAPGDTRLAPLYDVVSTNIYDLKAEMAMLIGGVEDPDRVSAESWRRMGLECSLGGQVPHRVENLIKRALRCARATREVAIAEDRHEPALDEIVALAERRAAQLV